MLSQRPRFYFVRSGSSRLSISYCLSSFNCTRGSPIDTMLATRYEELLRRRNAHISSGGPPLAQLRERVVADCQTPSHRVLRAANRAKPNVTGFNMHKMHEATGKPRYDPWERSCVPSPPPPIPNAVPQRPQKKHGTNLSSLLSSEAWRYEGVFTRWNRYSSALPGLGIATVAFTGYCAYEYFFLNDDHHAEGHGKEEEHH